MKPTYRSCLVALAMLSGAAGISALAPSAAQARELPAYLQCVPYAREVSGVRIFGDAHTWWKQAAAKYERGNKPRVGAVMAFRPHRKMRLGHVAAVSKVIDARTVLLDHANWSPINGRRGQIERDVKAIDVSPNNDWSKVRVWYHPINGLGKSQWPVHGFIYGDGKSSQPRRIAPRTQMAVTKAPSKSFSSAFSRFAASQPATTNPYRTAPALKPAAKPKARTAYRQATPLAAHTRVQRQSSQHALRSGSADPFAQIIARYD